MHKAITLKCALPAVNSLPAQQTVSTDTTCAQTAGRSARFGLYRLDMVPDGNPRGSRQNDHNIEQRRQTRGGWGLPTLPEIWETLRASGAFRRARRTSALHERTSHINSGSLVQRSARARAFVCVCASATISWRLWFWISVKTQPRSETAVTIYNNSR